MGGVQDKLVYIQDFLFCKYQNRGAAKFKVSFLCTAFYHKPASVIGDFSHQESTHFHLNQKTEIFGVNDRVVSGIFREDRAVFQGGRPYRVEKAGNRYLFDCQAIVRITVTVVVVRGQTEDET